MTEVIDATAGKIRSLPIQPKLADLLKDCASHCGIDVVRVISGGQAAKGTAGRRTGSTRHDLGWAADLQLEIDGRSLSFVKSADLPFFEAFVAYASQSGATGIGAGVDYMGPLTIHVGYGAEAVWGAGGKLGTAPKWLRDAFAKGRARRGPSPGAARYAVAFGSGNAIQQAAYRGGARWPQRARWSQHGGSNRRKARGRHACLVRSA